MTRSRTRGGFVVLAALVGSIGALVDAPSADALVAGYVLDTTWGGTGTGDGQFDGAGGIAVDPDTGDVLVVDRGNDRVQVFDADGTFVTAFGTTGTGNGELTDPTDVTHWPFTDGWVVTDTGNDRVSLWSSNLEFDRTYGTTGSGNGEFQAPHSVAAGGNIGALYVTDEGNDRVQLFNYGANTAAAYFTQFGTTGTGNGQFNGPQGIGLDSSGAPHVADSGNDRVEAFSNTGSFQSVFGTAGSEPGQFDGPRGVAVDQVGGDIAVVDATSARFQTFHGLGDLSFIGATTTGGTPFDIALGPDGSVYVTRGDTVERYVPPPRPDARIRVGNGALTANDVYNTTGASQARSATVGNLGTATFTVQTRNDGMVADDVRVQGLGSTARFTVTYKNGPTTVTNQVVAGTFEYADLPPGAVRNLTVIIKAKAGTPVNAAITRKITVTSQTLATVKDAVKATVTRR